jgi:hypothetical protein
VDGAKARLKTVTSWLKRHRHGAAFLIFLLTGLVVLASYIPGTGIQSCHGELATTGVVVQVCGPIGLSDVVVLSLALLLAVALIWDDLSEFSIGNLLTLKRRVEEVERKTDKAGDDIRALNLTQPPPDEKELAQAVEGLRVAVEAEPATGTGKAFDATVVVTQGGRTLSGRRAATEAEAIEIAAVLDRFIRVSERGSTDTVEAMQKDGLIPEMYPPVASKAIITWAATSHDYLQQWASVRNNLVHSPERLSDEDVEWARDLGSLLLRLVQRALRQAAG